MSSRLRAVLLSGALIAGPLSASANVEIYGGAGAGQAKLKSTELDRFMQASAATFTAPSSTKDDSDIGYKLFAEVDFTKHIGLDLGYYVLGQQTWRVSQTAPAPSLSNKLTYKTQGVGLSLLGRLPLTDGFNFFGRAGAFSWRANLNNVATSGLIADYNDTGTSALFGAGAEFKFMKVLGLRAEWERFAVGKKSNSGKATIDLISLNALFKFK